MDSIILYYSSIIFIMSYDYLFYLIESPTYIRFWLLNNWQHICFHVNRKNLKIIIINHGFFFFLFFLAYTKYGLLSKGFSGNYYNFKSVSSVGDIRPTDNERI